MKKGDKILILSVSLVCIIAVAVWLFLRSDTGTAVTVSQDNEVIYTLSLFENKTVKLEHNTVEIKNGKVKVTWADCKNQICVEHRAISKKGESIICLPNKVIVEIE